MPDGQMSMQTDPNGADVPVHSPVNDRGDSTHDGFGYWVLATSLDSSSWGRSRPAARRVWRIAGTSQNFRDLCTHRRAGRHQPP